MKKIVIVINNVLGSQKLLMILPSFNIIVGRYMRLSIFNNFNSLKLLSIALTKFASIIFMLKKFRSLKKRLRDDDC